MKIKSFIIGLPILTLLLIMVVLYQNCSDELPRQSSLSYSGQSLKIIKAEINSLSNELKVSGTCSLSSSTLIGEIDGTLKKMSCSTCNPNEFSWSSDCINSQFQFTEVIPYSSLEVTSSSDIYMVELTMYTIEPSTQNAVGNPIKNNLLVTLINPPPPPQDPPTQDPPPQDPPTPPQDPPNVKITKPSSNSLSNTQDVTIEGTCKSGLIVTSYGSGLSGSYSTPCNGGNFSKLVTLTSGDGPKLVGFKQVDSSGNESDPASVEITLNTPCGWTASCSTIQQGPGGPRTQCVCQKEGSSNRTCPGSNNTSVSNCQCSGWCSTDSGWTASCSTIQQGPGGPRTQCVCQKEGSSNRTCPGSNNTSVSNCQCSGWNGSEGGWTASCSTIQQGPQGPRTQCVCQKEGSSNRTCPGSDTSASNCQCSSW